MSTSQYSSSRNPRRRKSEQTENLKTPFKGTFARGNGSGSLGTQRYDAKQNIPTEPEEELESSDPSESSESEAETQSDDANITTFKSRDRTTGVKTVVAVGDPVSLTAGELQARGILVRKTINETRISRPSSSRDKGSSIPKYQISKQKTKDFKQGNVIELRLAELQNGATVITGVRGDRGFTRTRRFVVICEGSRYCAALSILTYQGQGVGAPGVVKAHHSVIYTGSTPPPILPGERPSRETDILRRPEIKVEGTLSENRLDPISRLNYAKVYQISQDSCEIFVFGRVCPEYMRYLQYNYEAVRQQSRPSPPGPPPPPAPTGQSPQGGSSSQPPRPTSQSDPYPGAAGGTTAQQFRTSARQQNYTTQDISSSPSVSALRYRQPGVSDDSRQSRSDTSVYQSPSPASDDREDSSEASEESEDEDESPKNETPPTSSPSADHMDPLSRQIQSLQIRARQYEVDLSTLSREHLYGLAQSSVNHQQAWLRATQEHQQAQQGEQGQQLSQTRSKPSASGFPKRGQGSQGGR